MFFQEILLVQVTVCSETIIHGGQVFENLYLLVHFLRRNNVLCSLTFAVIACVVGIDGLQSLTLREISVGIIICNLVVKFQCPKLWKLS